MEDHDKSKQQLVAELAEMRERIAALEQSERLYRTLAESTTDFIYLVDRTGNLLYASRSAARRFGCDRNSLVGKRQDDLFPPEMARRHRASIDRAFEAGEIVDEEDVFNFDGKDTWLATRFIPLRDEAGQVTSVMGISRDISKRKRAEEALQKAHNELERKVEERTAELTKANGELAVFKRFVEAAGEGFAMADLNHQVTYANPAMLGLMGLHSSGQAVGRNLMSLHPQSVQGIIGEAVIPTLLHGGHWKGETPIRSRAGQKRQALAHAFLVRNENGTPSHYGVVVTDITERKQAEEALRQSHDELETVYDGMVEGLVILDSETMRIVRVNSALCRLLGYAEEELLSMSITDIHPADDYTGTLKRIQTRIVGQVQEDTNVPMLRKDGSIVYADIMGNSLTYGGRPCVLGLFRDVTERRQAQAALERERQTLKYMLQSSDHERQVIAYEIHDGLAQYLYGSIMQFEVYDHLKETKPKDAKKAFAAGITLLHQSHADARRLISGVRPPILDDEGLAAAIPHLVNDFKRQEGTDIELHTEIKFDRLAPILENAVYRIAQEALTNACKHSKSEQIRVELVQHGDNVRLVVQDWGTGFDRSEVEDGRFGLAGMRERARLLGGTISVESTPGEGTCITVELPLAMRE
jgi:PAS domain S-box-containing protein